MSKPLMMVVDDNEDVRASLCALLHDEGFAVLSAEDGSRALTLLQAHPEVRAILLDVAMPHMNGATFRGLQLSDGHIADVPLILMSGRDDLPVLAGMLGASAWLQKPVCASALLEVLARYR